MDGEEAGVPGAIRNVFSKDMHKQLFFGMQSLSGMLPGRGWADRDMRLYPVMTEEFMIQWWTDLIMFSQAGLDGHGNAWECPGWPALAWPHAMPGLAWLLRAPKTFIFLRNSKVFCKIEYPEREKKRASRAKTLMFLRFYKVLLQVVFSR